MSAAELFDFEGEVGHTDKSYGMINTFGGILLSLVIKNNKLRAGELFILFGELGLFVKA